MGTIIGRTRKDGSKSFVAQIVIKKDGSIAHREAQTFDRKQAANAWIVKREAELKRPGGLEQKEDPTLSAVIGRYIAESKNPVMGTKAQVLKTIKNSDLGETKCSEITSKTLVSFARELTEEVERGPNRSATSTPSTTRSSRSSPIIRSIRSAGCRLMKSESRAMTSRTAKVVAKPIRNIPRSSPVPRAACSASSSSARTDSMRSRNSKPASVNVTARVVRTNSATPISRSSVAIVRDAVDCGIFSSRAAAEKLLLLAVRANSRSAKRRSLIALVDN
jgi:hypothetical protein